MEFQEAFTSSSTSTTTTNHQQNEMFNINSSLTTTNITNTDDPESNVVFADPCPHCGTKKRRLCPFHQHFNFTPRKKLFTTQPRPLFQASSVCQLTFPTSSSPEKTPFLGNRLPSSAEETPTPTPPSALRTPTSSSSGKVKKKVKFSMDFNESPEKRGSPGSSASRKSSASASKPQSSNRRSSFSNISTGDSGGDRSPASGSASDSETRSFGSSADKENWETMEEMLGVMNKLLSSGMFNTQQKEKPQETNNHQKKGSAEFSDSDNIMKGDKGVYKGSAQCSCGKKYQMILSILPE